MHIIEGPEWEILEADDFDYEKLLLKIEAIGRTCYKSIKDPEKDPYIEAENFIKGLISRGHLAMIEHHTASVRIICDRGVSHELVRHRIASYAQESTRYCNYAKEKFGNEITVISPSEHFTNPASLKIWEDSIRQCEAAYNLLIANGESAQIARSVLQNSLKTEIVITANLREWRTIFGLRAAKTAHPQMREIMVPLLEAFKMNMPAFFNDINP